MLPEKKISYSTIAPFLNKGNSAGWFSYLGIGIGALILLSCVQMFININLLVKSKNPRKDGFDFISVTKAITNENMGKDNRFTTEEVGELKTQTFIDDAAPLISNQFRVRMSAGSLIPFSTDLFLEAVPNSFLDTLPPAFQWQPGQVDLPIILSAEYLEMYNVFAPSQDLPQISAATAGAVNLAVECSSLSGTQAYRGHIVALSDRISSVLVPQSFLDYANKQLGGVSNPPAARVFIKTVDANNASLLNYLEQKGYYVNKDKTKFGRVKQVLQSIVAGLAGFSVLVILLAVLLFSFYLQLMIARSKDNLQLLLTLGYSPGWLSKTVSGNWVPVYAIVIFVALIVTQIFQYLFVHNVVAIAANLSVWVHWVVVLIAILLFTLCVFVNYRTVKRNLIKL